MAKIDFYYIHGCPSCRASETVANLCGVTLNKINVREFANDQSREEYWRMNPRRRVPFIVDEDLQLGESRSVSRYLVNRYMSPDNKLYPAEPKARAKIDELLDFDNGTLFQVGSRLLHPKLEKCVKELDPELEKSFREILHSLNKSLENNEMYILGESITLADITLASALTFFDTLGYDFKDFKSLYSYFERLKGGIPRFHEINDEPNQFLRQLVKSKQEGK